MALRSLTAGESHGRGLVAILEGMPAGVPLSPGDIARELQRRQWGHGRGPRMARRRDRALVISGIRHGRSIGSPVSFFIPNGERRRWARILSPDPPRDGREGEGTVSRPRPGHADLAGALKYGTVDCRDVLERASARETAARVALGACARALLCAVDIEVGSHVVSIGGEQAPGWYDGLEERVLGGACALGDADLDPVRSLDAGMSARAVEEIDAAEKAGDTVGGVFEVIAMRVPVGLGSYVQPDRRIDARIASALLSIPGVKGIEIGPAFHDAGLRGSAVHDPILPPDGERADGALSFRRGSNRAGGVEGGVSNGGEIVVRGAMKPLSTLPRPLPSIDLESGRPAPAAVHRGDTCSVPAAAIVGEAGVALVLADCLLEKFGGDTLGDLAAALDSYRGRISRCRGPSGEGRA